MRRSRRFPWEPRSPDARRSRLVLLPTHNPVESAGGKRRGDFAFLARWPEYFKLCDLLLRSKSEIDLGRVDRFEAATRLELAHLLHLAIGAIMDDDAGANAKAV